MRRVLQAPNLALATLWCDQLAAAGFPVRVLRAHAGSIAGEIPPDQALPEVWIDDDGRQAEARALFEHWMRESARRWACPGCGEIVEGPFETCWNCGSAAPP